MIAGKENDSIVNAYTVDECLFFIKKDRFMGFSNLGKTWHFYSVDYSYKCLKNNNSVKIFPIDVFHNSVGKMNKNYFNVVLKYARKNKDIKIIRTCCGYFKNNIFLAIFCLYRRARLHF